MDNSKGKAWNYSSGGEFSYSHCFMVVEMAQHCHKKLFRIVFSDNSNTSSSASGHSYEKLEEVLETSSLKSLGIM